MFSKTQIAAALASLLCLTALSGGCSSSQGPTQTKEFSLTDVKSIMVDYDGESVTMKECNSDKIVVVEYMDKTQKSYFAKIDLVGGVRADQKRALYRRSAIAACFKWEELFLVKLQHYVR